VFRTKPEIALDLLDQADAWGVRYACVVADARDRLIFAVFGQNELDNSP
jgi:hypothetical protein